MFHYYLARVKFIALGSSLVIRPQATGWKRRYFLDSGNELSLYAHFEDERRSVKIPAGESREIEVQIEPLRGEEVAEGTQWRIEYTPSEVLGSCEVTKLLGSWSADQDAPERARDPNINFFSI